MSRQPESGPDGEPNRAQLQERLVKITEAAEKWQSELGDRDNLRTDPLCDLAADDRFLPAPHRITTAFSVTLHAAVDHLHAMTATIVRHHTMHLAAPWSLARGALENAAIAYWLIHPDSRRERAARVLRWSWQNNADRWKAEQTMQSGNSAAKPPKVMTKIIKRTAAGLDGVRLPDSPNVHSTDLIKYAQQHCGWDVFLAWQVASGFAHGRSWAHMGVLSREEVFESDVPGMMLVKWTNDLGPIVWAAMQGHGLINATLRVYQQRCRPRSTGTPQPTGNIDAFVKR